MQDKILGDYKVLKQIGQGSLGLVLLAEHRFIKKPYVLKVLPDELAKDPGFVKRFEEEVGKLTTLLHPNIVKIHTVSFAEGHYFLVTDYITDVKTLADYIVERKGNLSEEEIIALLRQVASALDYAHAKGHEPILHRSLKPNNILVGRGGEVFLSDFGLAKIIGPGAVLARTFQALIQEEKEFSYPIENQKLAKLSNTFLQNLAFLAPEQKKMEEIGIGADIYAFGVLCYYLISGKYPDGLTEMPSQIVPSYQYDWDSVIKETLPKEATKRRKELIPLLDELISGSFRASMNEIKKESSNPVENIANKLTENTVVEYHPEIKDKSSFRPLGNEMVTIAGGEFTRGSNEGSRDEMPRHKIVIASFALDTYCVTNEQFVQFLEFSGGEKDENHDLIRLKNSRISRSAGKLFIETGYNKHPVVGVTWYGAFAYAKWVGKRLPTEAEWEIASLGGGLGPYPTGGAIEKSQANFFSSDTTPVMSYPPNGFGLYDMSGNVYEWCQDWYGYNYYETTALDPKNPKGPLQGVYRVLRGGCWKSLKDDLRSSHRHRNNPGAVNSTYGFRCASDL